MALAKGDKCPKCGIGTMTENKILTSANRQIVKGEIVIIRKYAIYLSCDFCDNNISTGVTRYE